MSRVRFYEWVAGKLLVQSARLRSRRMGPQDAHELRHLWAAINAGNSDPCDRGRDCTLDRQALAGFAANYPRGYGYGDTPTRVTPYSGDAA